MKASEPKQLIRKGVYGPGNEEVGTPSLAAGAKFVRMEDIAQEAGVSRRAVSRVLFPNGSKGIRVGEKTAEKVRAIAARLGYTPNLSAKQLAGEGSCLIGVLIDSFGPSVSYEVVQRLERALAGRGYRLLIGQVHDDVDSIGRYLRDFAGRGVDGVVSFVHSYPGFTDQIEELGRRMENVLYVGSPVVRCGDQVALDLVEGTKLLVHHLHEGGRRRIGLLLLRSGHSTMAEREHGFQTGLAELSLNSSECPVIYHDFRGTSPYTGDTRREVVHASVERLLEASPGLDGIIVHNDIFALGTIQALTERGLRVPEHIAVAGFDNMDFGWASSPPLTTVDQRPTEMAEKIAEALFERIQNPQKPYAMQKIRPHLVVRESTGPAL